VRLRWPDRAVRCIHHIDGIHCGGTGAYSGHAEVTHASAACVDMISPAGLTHSCEQFGLFLAAAAAAERFPQRETPRRSVASNSLICLYISEARARVESTYQICSYNLLFPIMHLWIDIHEYHTTAAGINVHEPVARLLPIRRHECSKVKCHAPGATVCAGW
jgi:hypothetical protein